MNKKIYEEFEEFENEELIELENEELIKNNKVNKKILKKIKKYDKVPIEDYLKEY